MRHQCLWKVIIFLFLDILSTCYEDNIDYNGNDIDYGPTGNIDNAEACQKSCQKLDQCLFWTFSSNGCILKTSDGNPQHSNGAISGPKYCSK